jgi:hypothetical protein
MMRVSAAGGEPTIASALDTAYAETNHRFPQFLPMASGSYSPPSSAPAVRR